MFDVSFSQSTAIHRFVELHDEALQNASLLLGGARGLRAAQSIIDDVRSQPRLTRRAIRELRQMHGLLSLEHVHDPDRAEAGYFAVLDPAACYVEDICLLADGLAQALEETVVEPAPSHAPANAGGLL